jgi:hypothetical protein
VLASTAPRPSTTRLSYRVASAIELIVSAFGLVRADIIYNRQILDTIREGTPELETFRQYGLFIPEQGRPMCVGLAKQPDLTVSSSTAEQVRTLNRKARIIPEIDPSES